MEQKDSAALLPCAFILINSQITLGPLLIFLTFSFFFFCQRILLGVLVTLLSGEIGGDI